MTRPTINITDLSTGESITREMNDAEFAQHLIDKAEAEARRAEIEAQATQRQAILDRLGLSQEEANILLGGN